MTTTNTLASLVNSGYGTFEQTAKKTPLPTIRLLLRTYLLPGNAFSEPFLSNLGATTNLKVDGWLNKLKEKLKKK
jgi:hypothetical protein